MPTWTTMSKIASHEEVLEILSEQARNGSVTAALERALRARDKADPDKFDDELDRLLSK